MFKKGIKMKSILVLTFLAGLHYSGQAFASSCISVAKAQQIVNQMEINIEAFSRAELMENVVKNSDRYVSVVRGENQPECEFEGQCKSQVHHTLNTGNLEVLIACTGESSYLFVNDSEHD